MLFYESKHNNSPGYIALEQHENINFGLHYHKNIEYIYLFDGSLTIRVDNFEVSLNKGECCIILPNQSHSIISSSKSNCFIGIFSTHYFPDLYETYSKLCTPTPTIKIPNMESYINDLYVYQDNKYRITSILCYIFSEFLVGKTFEERNNIYFDFVSKTLDYLEKNYNKNANLIELAGLLNYNSHYVSKLFGECFRKNFSQVLNEYRVEHAINLIQNSNDNFTEIAYKCGFNSIRSFNRNFAFITDKTPSDFKKNL